MRVGRFEALHLEVIASEVQYLSILQDSVCALFIVQAKVVRITLLKFGLTTSLRGESPVVYLTTSTKSRKSQHKIKLVRAKRSGIMFNDFYFLGI